MAINTTQYSTHKMSEFHKVAFYKMQVSFAYQNTHTHIWETPPPQKKSPSVNVYFQKYVFYCHGNGATVHKLTLIYVRKQNMLFNFPHRMNTVSLFCFVIVKFWLMLIVGLSSCALLYSASTHLHPLSSALLLVLTNQLQELTSRYASLSLTCLCTCCWFIAIRRTYFLRF